MLIFNYLECSKFQLKIFVKVESTACWLIMIVIIVILILIINVVITLMHYYYITLLLILDIIHNDTVHQIGHSYYNSVHSWICWYYSLVSCSLLAAKLQVLSSVIVYV